jgi:hypothetical protein
MVMAILSDPLWRRNYMRLERNHQQGDHTEEFQPEWRLPPGKFYCTFQVDGSWDLTTLVKSNPGRTPGHDRPVHLRLDNLLRCPLDRTHHWQRPLRRRVGFTFPPHPRRSWNPNLGLRMLLLVLMSHLPSRTILVYSGIFTFLVDAYPTYSASALAANSFMRSSFGGIFPLFGIQSKCLF